MTCTTCGAAVDAPYLYCSRDCLNAERRARYALNPRPRKPRRSLEERFWSRVRRGDGCWEWQGYCAPAGYGQIGVENHRLKLTHRLSWELANGPIPDGLVVRHRCDNPPCVNPDHLELGTIADNSRDAVERGQIARGFRLPRTILSPEAVAAIRSRYQVFNSPGRRGLHSNRAELAAEFGVSAKYVAEVAAGRERADV